MGNKRQTKTQKLNFRFISDREASFRKSWFSKDSPCSAHQMAIAGFHYICGDDSSYSARCFYCEKELDWEVHDDPWEEHVSHCPNCPYVKMFDQAPESITVRELLKLENERVQFLTEMLKQKCSSPSSSLFD